MNKLSLEVKYKPISSVTVTCICVVWFIAGFAALWMLSPLIAPLGWFVGFLAWLLGGALFIYIPFVLLSAHGEGGILRLNRDGIFFPPSLLGFGPTTSVRWNEIKAVDYKDNNEISPPLLLTLQNGRRLSLDTSKAEPEQLEQMLLTIELWSPNALWSDRASNFRDGLQNSNAGIETSFTRVWEDELQRRYAVTTFAPHEPGKRLEGGRLTILKQLAFGGFSAVYLAEDDERQKVVVKELVVNSTDVQVQAKAQTMFQREADLLARLNHPQVARVLDHFVEEGRHYLVLECVEGENLRELVRRSGPLPPQRIWPLAQQMLDILEYLHGQQPPIVHRDFTPDNLILRGDGTLTLVDFGAANQFLSSATGTLVGKQSYMPIEQIRGKAEPRSDLYALGCTLSFLSSGADPEPLSVQPLNNMHPQLANIIERLTQLEPEQRPASATEVCAMLKVQT